MNRLAQSHSPYLLQHQNNPVDWHPWDDTALELARSRQMPVFLSVGYAACHWCHVMEHESFEDTAIASVLNQHFVCVKVDREERPDVDKIYMNAVQAMTGHGGWPMSVFLTPDLRPFYAGTYWPNPPRGGMPGFAQVLDAIIHAWNERRGDVLAHADEITDALHQMALGPEASGDDIPSASLVEEASERLLKIADTKLGGFGAAPKFPHVTDLDLLLRRWARDRDDRKLQVVTTSLDAMAAGGIFDHIGGGFARYSVDAHWLVPHFEKMLYDNALLSRLYVDAFQATGHLRYADVARQTLDYLLREMHDSAGGFHSSEDADSEGVEGKYYVWTPAEVMDALGTERGQLFCEVYDITSGGNFEGFSIPRLQTSIESFAIGRGVDPVALADQLRADREILRSRRDARVHPGRDDKVLMSWNALAIDSLATAGAVLSEPRYLTAAEQAATFIWKILRRPDGRFHHAYRRGTAHLHALGDDLADSIGAMITLYRGTGRARWIERATTLAGQLIDHYQDRDRGGFFYTADDATTVIARTKDWHDSSVRGANAAAAMSLLRLSALTGDTLIREAAHRTLIAGAEVMRKQSAAAGHLLASLDLYHEGREQFVIAAGDWESAEPLRQAFHLHYRPHADLSWVIGEAPSSGPVAFINANKPAVAGQPTLYRCVDYTCDQPLTGKQALERLGEET